MHIPSCISKEPGDVVFLSNGHTEEGAKACALWPPLPFLHPAAWRPDAAILDYEEEATQGRETR